MNTKVIDRLYDKVFEQGVLMQIHIRRWSATCSLNERDLNLNTDTKIPDIFHLGKKFLIDKKILKQFTNIETNARNCLKKRSFSFPVQHVNFVPNKAVTAVQQEINEFKQAYDQLSIEFVEKYPEYKEQTLNKYPQYRDSLINFYPPQEQLRARYSFELLMFRISMPQQYENINLHMLQAEENIKQETQRVYEQQANEQIGLLKSFVHDSMANVRDSILDTVTIYCNKIAKNEVFGNGNKKSILKRFDEFANLNIFGDVKLEEKINEAKKLLLDESRDFRENAQDRQELSVALKAIKTTAENTSEISKVTGEYFRHMMI